MDFAYTSKFFCIEINQKWIVIRDQMLNGMDVPWISAVALFDTGETEFFPDLVDAAGVERIGNGYGTSKR